MIPRFLFYWWKRVQAVFLDAEEEDEEFQEPYHAFIHCLIWLIGKRLSRILVYLFGAPFGAVYVIISSVVRIFFVVVRVKSPEEDGDGAYPINFYLDGDDTSTVDEGPQKTVTAAESTKSGKESGSTKSLAKKASSLIAKTGIKKTLSGMRQGSQKSDDVDKDGNEGAYTFEDAKPDAFGAVPDEHEEEHEVKPKKKPESKGAKRLKKVAGNKNMSFVIDPDFYNDPSAAALPSPPTAKRTVNKSPPQKFTARLSFGGPEEGKEQKPNKGGAAKTLSGYLSPLTSFNLNDGSAGAGAGSGGTGKLTSPKTSFTFNDGSTASAGKSITPKTSFNLADGSATQAQSNKSLSNKSSFNSNDGNTVKLAPKLSFGGLDSLLNLVPIVATGKATPPGPASDAAAPASGPDGQQAPHTSVGGGVMAVAFANKLMHKAGVRRRKTLNLMPLGDQQAEAEGDVPGVSGAALDELNDTGSESTDYDEDDSDKKKHKDRTSLGMGIFGPHKKREKKEAFHLPEEGESERTAGSGVVRNNSGGRPSHGHRKQPSRRLSKQQSVARRRTASAGTAGAIAGLGGSGTSQGYVSSGSDTQDEDGHGKGDNVDGEGYRLEEGDESDFEDEENPEGYGEELEEEEDEYDSEAEALRQKQLKSNLLFTPDDIIRIFPSNANETAKLEIEDEIRKLKVSSEAAVATATEEMKADFKAKINHAVAEIRTLKDAIISSRVDRLPLGNRSFTLNDGSTANGSETSPPTTGRASPHVGPDGRASMRMHKKGSFFQPIPGDGAHLRTQTLTPSFATPRGYMEEPSNQNPRPGQPAGPVAMNISNTGAPGAGVAAGAVTAQEMDEMQRELQNLKGDMSDIKKLLATIVTKMK